MSTELKSIAAMQGNKHITNTAFFGGNERGRCIQLTQMREGRGQAVQLTVSQAKAQIAVLADFISGEY